MQVLSLTFRDVPVEIRETFAFGDQAEAGCRFFWQQEGIEEVAVLSTCNRVEILWFGECDRRGLEELWAEWSGNALETLCNYTRYHQGEDALTHLLSVASGLDSMVLGEPQILGQLKDCYLFAREAHSLGPHLNRYFEKAFFTAKKTRSETAIGAYAINISFLAVKLAEQIFDSLENRKALLLGAGEMAELAARHLLEHKIDELMIANRTYDRAVELAEEVGAVVVPFDTREQRLPEVDVLLVSTGAPDYVVTRDMIAHAQKKRRNQPLLIVDISVPRNADPALADLPNVYLYDVDALRKLAEANAARRQEAADEARAIIADQVRRLMSFREAEPIQHLIGAMHQRWRTAGAQEVERTVRRLGLDENGKKALETMIQATIKKILHPSQEAIKHMFDDGHWNEDTDTLVRTLFGIKEDEL